MPFQEFYVSLLIFISALALVLFVLAAHSTKEFLEKK